MAYKRARFIIYYKSGNTKIEDRNDPKYWDNVIKYEYKCQECGESYPYYPEVSMTHCLKCAKEDKDVKLVRQTIIAALGIQFDPMPLQEDGQDVIGSTGNPLRVQLAPFILKGSSTYNYGFFQDKIAELRSGKNQPAKTLGHGLRIGMVVNPKGKCFCMVGFIAKGQPTIQTYYTNIHSLGIDANARKKLHSLKLKECGTRFVTKKGEKIKQLINLDLGERLES
jgi:hypothetical protein